MKKLTEYKYFIFDFDGTIADMVVNWDGWMEGIYKIMKKYDPTFTVNQSYEVENLQNYFLEKYENQGIHKEMTDFSNQYEWDNCKNVKIISKSVDFIKNASGKVIVWTNNGTEFVSKQLEKIGILGKVETIIGRDKVKLIKPDAEAFYELIWDGKTPKDQYLFVGNDLDNDAGAAKGAGIDFLDVREL